MKSDTSLKRCADEYLMIRADHATFKVIGPR
jgi:hypothetical protein